MKFFGFKKRADAAASSHSGANSSAKTGDQMSIQESIIQINLTKETMLKKIGVLQTRIKEDEVEIKARAAQNDKQGAIFFLKRKQGNEKEVSNLMGRAAMLERQVKMLDSQAGSKAMVTALQTGKETFKLQALNLNEVDALVSDVQAQMDEQQEIEQILCFGESAEEEDYVKQYELLVADAQLEQVATPPNTVIGSKAVSTPVSGAKKKAPAPATSVNNSYVTTEESDEKQLLALMGGA